MTRKIFLKQTHHSADQFFADMDLGHLPHWSLLTVQSLLAALKARDEYTYGHCVRVAMLARLLARAAGFDEFQQQVIEFSALFHDLGKIGIPDKILKKQTRLTPAEEAIMRSHPVKSAEILNPLTELPFFRFILPGVKHHHERFDGRGYPDKVAAENIPLGARIILVVDTFDAMTTMRPYRGALTPEIAYKELKTFSGRQFDKEVVKIFLQAHPLFDLNHTDTIDTHIARVLGGTEIASKVQDIPRIAKKVA